MKSHTVVSPQDWVSARRKLLEKEKAFTQARDELSRERRALPWERVEKNYVFESSAGRETLAELFEGRSQLVVYHLMFAPDWDTPCKSCSFWADNFNGIVSHLAQRDVTMIAVSRATVKQIETFRKRMGWTFKWASSGGNDFNYDYNVSFRAPQQAGVYNYSAKTNDETDLPGVSVFCKGESGEIFHTYSAYSRGIDLLNTAYNYLDLVPKGRDEEGLRFNMAWVNYHDLYGT